MRDPRSPTSSAACLPNLSRLRAFAAAWLIAATAHAEGPPAGPPTGPMLQLMNGGFMAGELKDSAEPGILRWQATPFVAPFDLFMSGVNAIHWPPSEGAS